MSASEEASAKMETTDPFCITTQDVGSCNQAKSPTSYLKAIHKTGYRLRPTLVLTSGLCLFNQVNGDTSLSVDD